MCAGVAADASGRERVVERLGQQCLPDVRLGLAARAQILDAQPHRRLLAGEAGTNRGRRRRVGVERNLGRQGEGFGAGLVRGGSIHQAL